MLSLWNSDGYGSSPKDMERMSMSSFSVASTTVMMFATSDPHLGHDAPCRDLRENDNVDVMDLRVGRCQCHMCVMPVYVPWGGNTSSIETFGTNQLLVAHAVVEVLNVDAHAPLAQPDGAEATIIEAWAFRPYAGIDEADYDAITEVHVLQVPN
jgi:hypothetical protein